MSVAGLLPVVPGSTAVPLVLALRLVHPASLWADLRSEVNGVLLT